MAKDLMTIQVNLCILFQESALNSPELSLLKFLPLIKHHFLAATFDFTSFFT